MNFNPDPCREAQVQPKDEFQAICIIGLLEPFLAVCCMRCPFSKYFQICTFLPEFSNILPFFALFLKNRMHALAF